MCQEHMQELLLLSAWMLHSHKKSKKIHPLRKGSVLSSGLNPLLLTSAAEGGHVLVGTLCVLWQWEAMSVGRAVRV